jgi:hypothetical protein
MSGSPKCAPFTYPGLSTIYWCPCPSENEFYCESLPSTFDNTVTFGNDNSQTLKYDDKGMGSVNILKYMLTAMSNDSRHEASNSAGRARPSHPTPPTP